jgi:hypothetical protein
MNYPGNTFLGQSNHYLENVYRTIFTAISLKIKECFYWDISLGEENRSNEILSLCLYNIKYFRLTIYQWCSRSDTTIIK